MVEFIRGQTVSIYAEISEEDIPDPSEIWSISMVIKQNGLIRMDKKTADCYIEGRRIYTDLSQTDTLKFQEGSAEIQLSVLLENNSRCITKVGEVLVGKLLKEGVQT